MSLSFDSLPVELLTRFFGFFNMSSLGRLSTTSKKLHEIGNQDESWLSGPGFVNAGVHAKEICKQLSPFFKLPGNNYFDLLRSNLLTIDTLLAQSLLANSRRETKIENESLKSTAQVLYLHTDILNLMSQSLDKITHAKLTHSNRKDIFLAYYGTPFINYLKLQNNKINDENALNKFKEMINNSSFILIQVSDVEKLTILFAKLKEFNILNLELPPIIIMSEKKCLADIVNAKFSIPFAAILPLEPDNHATLSNCFCDAINPIWTTLSSTFECIYDVNKINTQNKVNDESNISPDVSLFRTTL